MESATGIAAVGVAGAGTSTCLCFSCVPEGGRGVFSPCGSTLPFSKNVEPNVQILPTTLFYFDKRTFLDEYGIVHLFCLF